MKKNSPINIEKNEPINDFSALTSPDSAENRIDRLFPHNPDASRFIIICRRSDYSASRIARAIEDCDSNVLNLNVTNDNVDPEYLAVEIRVDRRNAAAIARSLARYDYTMLSPYSDDGLQPEVDSTQRERVDELLRILDI